MNKFVNESVNTMREANHARGAQTRRKILSASAKVFLQKGYAGASSREVAELAGVSNGSPFYLYGNKEGVLLELVRQMFAGQFEMVERMLGAEADPLLVYAVETSLQMHIAECSEQLRELYAAAYTLPSTSEFIYQNTAEKLMRIFGPYLPGATARDFMSWISRRQASHAVSWRSPVTCILQWRQSCGGILPAASASTACRRRFSARSWTRR